MLYEGGTGNVVHKVGGAAPRHAVGAAEGVLELEYAVHELVRHGAGGGLGTGAAFTEISKSVASCYRRKSWGYLQRTRANRASNAG